MGAMKHGSSFLVSYSDGLCRFRLGYRQKGCKKEVFGRSRSFKKFLRVKADFAVSVEHSERFEESASIKAGGSGVGSSKMSVLCSTSPKTFLDQISIQFGQFEGRWGIPKTSRAPGFR